MIPSEVTYIDLDDFRAHDFRLPKHYQSLVFLYCKGSSVGISKRTPNVGGHQGLLVFLLLNVKIS